MLSKAIKELAMGVEEDSEVTVDEEILLGKEWRRNAKYRNGYA